MHAGHISPFLLLFFPLWTAIVCTSDVFDVGGNLCFLDECESAGVHYWSRTCFGMIFVDAPTDRIRALCAGIPVGPRRCTGYPSSTAFDEVPMACPKR